MTTGDLAPDEFRTHGRAAVDWVADYLEHIRDRPVLSQVEPGDIAARLPDAAPATGERMDTILADLEPTILPGITHWNHPRFFAYFAITGSGPGIIGELVTAALNVNGMLWRTSPSATELEQVTLGWLRQLIGLPDGFAGIICDTASISTMLALAAARERGWPGVRERGPAGFEGQTPRVYCSDQAHSSVQKAAITLGLGLDNVLAVPSDDRFRMDVGALRSLIREDLGTGRTPAAVVATVGTTSTTSIDPVPGIAEVCEEHDLWLHVDGAYGGLAAIVPEMRHVLDGTERADSVVVNPHKWLFTPIDCSAFFVRDPDALKAAFRLVPEYLTTSETDVDNLMDWGVQLGRRFRALKLWMVMRHFGAEGLAARIREHLRLATIVADRMDGHAGFVRAAPAPFSTVCFRAVFEDTEDPDEEDRRNRVLLDAINATGEAYLSHTVLDGRYVLRMAIGNLRTTEQDVLETLDLIEREADRLR
ncbi:MAG: amino acid decarboxylase [Actinobacteria bacterium]|nr:amino acid decarboxylase [Actinomycetota bacterium]